MKLLSRVKQARNEAHLLIEQQQCLTHFCGEEKLLTLGNSQNVFKNLLKLDKKPSNNTSQSLLYREISESKGTVIVSAYSCSLLAFIEQLYRNSSFHLYIVKDKTEPLPFLMQLSTLKRISLISHKEALITTARNQTQIPIFISIPEFHPKSLSSEHIIKIYGHRCKFSSYPWLLQHKQQLPIYYLAASDMLSSAKCAKTTYKGLAECYQSSKHKIYSWSRIQSHQEEKLSQRFIAQSNQLEALLRYMRPHLSDIDLQPTLSAIERNKLALLSGSMT